MQETQRTSKVYDEQGADELCFLDITASVENRGLLLDIVNQNSKQMFYASYCRGRREVCRGLENYYLQELIKFLLILQQF